MKKSQSTDQPTKSRWKRINGKVQTDLYIWISLNLASNCQIGNKSLLVQVMVWRRTCHKPAPLLITQFTDLYLCHQSYMSLRIWGRAIQDTKFLYEFDTTVMKCNLCFTVVISIYYAKCRLFCPRANELYFIISHSLLRRVYCYIKFTQCVFSELKLLWLYHGQARFLW